MKGFLERYRQREWTDGDHKKIAWIVFAPYLAVSFFGAAITDEALGAN